VNDRRPRRSANTEDQEDLVAEVKSLAASNQARIDALVEQLYDITSGSCRFEGRLMRLAGKATACHARISSRTTRRRLKTRSGSTASRSFPPRLEELVAHQTNRIKQIRGDIQSLATETGLR